MVKSHFSFPWNTLICWYKMSGRSNLPWRMYELNDQERIYRVWLSEILLQQTQVERVRGYFLRILERFPTLELLAESDYETFFPYYQ
jgi:A/G-specific adenine glycosylase